MESKLCEHLERQALGSPLVPNMPFNVIYSELTENQGYALTWTPETKEQAFRDVADAIFGMIKNVDAASKLNRSETSEKLISSGTDNKQHLVSLSEPSSAVRAVEAALFPATSPSRSLSQATSQENIHLQKPRPPSTEKPSRGSRMVSEDKLAVRAMQDILRAKDIEIEDLTKEIQKLRHLYKHAKKASTGIIPVATAAAAGGSSGQQLGPEQNN